MSQRRATRGLPPRSDREIVDHEDTMLLLQAVAAGRVSRASTAANAAFTLHGHIVGLRSLAREDLVFAPIGGLPTLAPRGARLLAAWRGEATLPPAE